MNRLAVLLTLVLCFPLAAHADDASHRAKAEELVTVLHMERMVTQATDSIMQQTIAIATQRSGGTLTPDATIAVGNFQKKLLEVTDPQMGWKAVEPEFVRLFTTTFTEEELDGILAFYKSPSGKALLAKMPDANDQANKLMQSKFVALQPQLKQMFDAFIQNLPAKPAPASTPALPSAPAPSTPGKTAPK